jgi:RHH-type proline utilization regulon transcriptional repressor/proline dehydrogenase/delta 1-pyrroline-5-carboxylate dehydrogenase
MTTDPSPDVPSVPPLAPILSPELAAIPKGARAGITQGWIRDETVHLRELLAQAALPDAERDAAQATAGDLVRRVR